MIANTLLFVLLIGLLLHMKHQRQQAREQSELQKRLECVTDMLMIWAQMWGKDPDIVRTTLVHRIEEFKKEVVIHAYHGR